MVKMFHFECSFCVWRYFVQIVQRSRSLVVPSLVQCSQLQQVLSDNNSYNYCNVFISLVSRPTRRRRRHYHRRRCHLLSVHSQTNDCRNSQQCMHSYSHTCILIRPGTLQMAREHISILSAHLFFYFFFYSARIRYVNSVIVYRRKTTRGAKKQPQAAAYSEFVLENKFTFAHRIKSPVGEGEKNVETSLTTSTVVYVGCECKFCHFFFAFSIFGHVCVFCVIQEINPDPPNYDVCCMQRNYSLNRIEPKKKTIFSSTDE